MVFLDMTPASDSPSAASCAAASASLLYCLVIAFHLDNCSSLQRCRKARPIQRQILVGQQPESLELVPAQALSTTLGETVDEESQFVPSKQHDCAKPTGSAASFPRDALLDDTTTEIRIDKTPPGAADRLAQIEVLKSLAVRKTRKRLGLERMLSRPHEHL